MHQLEKAGFSKPSLEALAAVWCSIFEKKSKIFWSYHEVANHLGRFSGVFLITSNYNIS